MIRRTHLKAIVGTLAATTALLAGACGSDDESEPAAAGGSSAPAAAVEFVSVETDVPVGYDEPQAAPLTLVYLNAFGGNELLNAVGDAFEAEVTRLGGTFRQLDAKIDPDLQVSQFQQSLAQDVDGIFVRPVDPRALQPLLSRAEKAGVPVITVDATEDPKDSGGFTSQIWDRRDEMAYLQVKALRQVVEGRGPIGQVSTEIPAPTLQQVVALEKKWAGEFGLDIAASVPSRTDDPAGGEAAMTALLTRESGIEGAVAYNDPTALGAAAAARQRGLSEFPLVGINGGTQGLEGVSSGRLLATVRLDAVGLGRFGAWGLYNAVAKKSIPPTVRSGDLTVVTADNVDDVPTWQEEIEREYGG